MTLKLIVLFFTPLLSGLLIYLVPKGKNTNFKLLLVFAGAYLFSITVIHVLPELFQQPIGQEQPCSFFLQHSLAGGKADGNVPDRFCEF